MAEYHYQRVYRELKQRILQGDYEVGSALPSENELSLNYGLTRVTVRQALATLEREGYIEKQHGRGNFVKAPRESLNLLSVRGFSEVLGETNHAVRTRILSPPAHVPWPDPFFYELPAAHLAKPCLNLQRLRFADENPVMLESAWLPDTGLSRLRQEPFVDGSFFKSLRRWYGIEITGMEQHLRAVAADAPTAKALQMRKGNPVLFITRQYTTSQPGLVIYGTIYCDTTHYAIGS
ncbi:MAG: GntR family transcriptional regulator [Bernardetiaceae bacterium]|jgi:GntR family transcriptional regulator/GntR family frlABCD operon transcriptional regulator|nr:GntR family transcriptional regulator [Bernardetiaceae bacterium]